MKKNIFALSALLVSFISSASYASDSKSNVQDFACYVTQENETPTDRKDFRFWVHVDPAGASSLTYQRLTYLGYGRSMGIYGCDNASVKKQDSDHISMECAMDGEEGYVDIFFPGVTGEIYFYMPKLSYEERTMLKVQCVEQ